jgi:hypothetical protein
MNAVRLMRANKAGEPPTQVTDWQQFKPLF